MADQIYIGNFAKGLQSDITPFNIDNDAFPVLYNFYSWRGRAKRKRGTLFLGQLTDQVLMAAADPQKPWQNSPLVLNGGGTGNLKNGNGLVSTATIVPGSVNLLITGFTYKDLNSDASLLEISGVNYNPAITNITNAATAVVTVTNNTAGEYVVGSIIYITGVSGMTEINNAYYEVLAVGGGGNVNLTINVNSTSFSTYTSGGFAYIDGGTVNYSTCLISIIGGAGLAVTGTFSYYPNLPVMGLRDLVTSTSSQLYPLLIAFDTTFSYQCNQQTTNASFWNVNFYKNSQVPFTWSAGDANQFWTTNYPSTTSNFSGSLWATNNKPGLHFVNGTYVAGSGTNLITFNFKSNAVNFKTLLVNDYLFFNEWNDAGVTINQLVGFVSNNAGAAAGNYVVTFPNNVTVSGTGVAQLLTNSLANKDGIKWYDGDPTNATGIPTNTGLGWVNFAPPLTDTGTTVSIGGATAKLYYLVGALAIVPFKNRLLFFSPYIQAADGTDPIQLQNFVIWSWNGTPYYTPTLLPAGQTAASNAYFVNQRGLGGFLGAAISAPIISVGGNQDVLLVGFGGQGVKTRFAYTGNDLDPFLFFTINYEYPSSATFSSVVMDRGTIDIGPYGISMTDQQSSQRIDIDIPDEVFNIQNANSGALRVNAIRDFFKEWIYFTYPLEDSDWKFPTQTFLFNYRDNTWAILYENYTAQGYYRPSTNTTWSTIGFSSWSVWRQPWNAGINQAFDTNIIGGTPQGFVLLRDEGTDEGRSGTIVSVANSGGSFQITSTNHCVTMSNPGTGTGDYLALTGLLGTGSNVELIGKVISTADANTFVVDIPFPVTATITGVAQLNPLILTTTTNYKVGQIVKISGVVGMTQLNGNFYNVTAVTATTITLNVDATAFSAYVSGGTITPSYLGGGTYRRLSQPLIQTKQFPFYWDQGRQTRLCAQKYLLESTEDSQVTLNIYLSQDADDAWNDPAVNGVDNGLIYSQILYTCPESTNLGLTPANSNLQMPIASNQSQIWHRMNTSLMGDSIQIGITLNDTQMRNIDYATDEIALHGIQLTVERGPLLA